MELSRRSLIQGLLGGAGALAVVPAAALITPAKGVIVPPHRPIDLPPASVPVHELANLALNQFARALGTAAVNRPLPFYGLEPHVSQFGIGIREYLPASLPANRLQMEKDVHHAMDRLGFIAQDRRYPLQFLELDEPPGVESWAMSNQYHHALRAMRFYDPITDEMHWRFDCAVFRPAEHSPPRPRPSRTLLFV